MPPERPNPDAARLPTLLLPPPLPPFSAPDAAKATGLQLLLPLLLLMPSGRSAFDLTPQARISPPSAEKLSLSPLLLLSSSSSTPKLILPRAKAGLLKSFLPEDRV